MRAREGNLNESQMRVGSLPVCQVAPGRCVQGALLDRHLQLQVNEIPCPSGMTHSHAAAPPTSSGAWNTSSDYVYLLDIGLAKELALLFAQRTVTEFGAGKGCYTATLRRYGIDIEGYDGLPETTGQSEFMHVADLTEYLELPMADWVLMLEVAEHVPALFEEALLSNVDRHAREGAVLSWSNDRIGNGHANPRNGSYVQAVMRRRGFKLDVATTQTLRQSVTSWHWFRHNLQVFRRSSDPRERCGTRRAAGHRSSLAQKPVRSLPLLAILTRAGRSESCFRNLARSIHEQLGVTGRVLQLISYDNPASHTWLQLHLSRAQYHSRIVNVRPREGVPCHSSLYLNTLLKHVPEGAWVVVLDDDSLIVDRWHLARLLDVAGRSSPGQVLLQDAFYSGGHSGPAGVLPEWSAHWPDDIPLEFPFGLNVDSVSYVYHASRKVQYPARCSGDKFVFQRLVSQAGSSLVHVQTAKPGIWANYMGAAGGVQSDFECRKPTELPTSFNQTFGPRSGASSCSQHVWTSASISARRLAPASTSASHTLAHSPRAPRGIPWRRK